MCLIKFTHVFASVYMCLSSLHTYVFDPIHTQALTHARTFIIIIINRTIYIAPYNYEASNPITIARYVSKTRAL